jgi:outer membrane immunogenic protein
MLSIRRYVVLASAACLAIGLAAGSASAADMPMYTKAPPVGYNWTGAYVGVDVGYAWHDPTVTFTPNDRTASIFLTSGGHTIAPVSYDLHSVFGGFDAGYNWQFNRSWLVGVETDFNWSSLDGRGTSTAPFSGDGCSTPVCGRQVSADQEILWFGTLRARAGWLATSDLLLYGTGGFAYGKISENVVATNSGPGALAIGLPGPSRVTCAAGGICYQGTSEFIATGWTAGAGLEFHVPGSTATWKLEYLFVDLGSGGLVNAIAANGAASSFGAKYPDVQFNTVKLGLNWKLP